MGKKEKIHTFEPVIFVIYKNDNINRRTLYIDVKTKMGVNKKNKKNRKAEVIKTPFHMSNKYVRNRKNG